MVRLSSKTPNKLIVLCDVYISTLVEISSCPLSSLTDKSNTDNNYIEETQMIALNPINILMRTDEITNIGTHATTFHKRAQGGNLCVRFRYVPLTFY